MKKILCVLLSVFIMCGCLGMFAGAEDKPYVRSWTLQMDEESSERAAMALVKNVGTKENPAFELWMNDDGTVKYYADDKVALTAPDSTYIRDKEPVYFVIIPISKYASDQSTVYKALPEDYKLSVIIDENMEIEGEIVLTPIQTVSTEVYADNVLVGNRAPAYENEKTYTVSVDVYCIDSLEENMLIKVYNLQPETIADVKDFLLNFFNFFLQLFKWFFGLDVELPTLKK